VKRTENYIEQIIILVHHCNDQLIKLLRSYPDNNKIKELGIGLKQGIVLKFLLDRSGCTQRELTKFLQITSSSCSELIAKLEQAGYIRRSENAVDKRTFDIFLTEDGRCLGEKYGNEIRFVLRSWIPNLSSLEKELLYKLLTKFSSGIDEQISKNQENRTI
jgi:DNA-binding MarR family transcriptional regulator